MAYDKRAFWNIYKGIAITCIVIGHSCLFAKDFVYTFHLALFFFSSGFLYKEEKYGDTPFENIACRIQRSWRPYVGYAVVYILCHNFFVKAGLLTNVDGTAYTGKEITSNLLNSIIFNFAQGFLGACWFIAPLILASGLFGAIVYYGRKVEKMTHTSKSKTMCIIVLSVLSGGTGYAMSIQNESLLFHMQTSVLVIPLFAAAYFMKLYCPNFISLLTIPGGCAALCMILLGLHTDHRVELSSAQLDYFYWIFSFSGIYLCMFLSKTILKRKYLAKFFIWIGEYSFEIMVMHFAVFKLIDKSYALFTYENDCEVFGLFPCAYPDILWFIYLALGICIPPLIGMGLRIGKTYLSNSLYFLQYR